MSLFCRCRLFIAPVSNRNLCAREQLQLPRPQKHEERWAVRLYKSSELLFRAITRRSAISRQHTVRVGPGFMHSEKLICLILKDHLVACCRRKKYSGVASNCVHGSHNRKPVSASILHVIISRAKNIFSVFSCTKYQEIMKVCDAWKRLKRCSPKM